ncbi:uncharacterized protein MYCFIDRAFT_195147 [Pseudocercospora fijiensis CIRAD86]|uniref:Uncharacterized protein n=1 Tax=Pseudocercospora fijiensis (strain CIRAD86) TaxID=383855 RepID=M3AHA6_PSEFD|nr:uncharacterized protein MYCFIDRAFT_195147 [Pseudocercospora fijiensis CIRAD86]EME83961.1 hypothetical protein MYCFIDRAFT_195147 [Pseudocercospora fijiensis CIRAD86]
MKPAYRENLLFTNIPVSISEKDTEAGAAMRSDLYSNGAPFQGRLMDALTEVESGAVAHPHYLSAHQLEQSLRLSVMLELKASWKPLQIQAKQEQWERWADLIDRQTAFVPTRRMALADADCSNNDDLDLDVSIIPWSQRGSYLSLATKAGRRGCLTPGSDVYLVTHCRQFGFPLFALRPIPPGHALPAPSGFQRANPLTTVKAKPGILSWQHEGSILTQVAFLHDRCLRFRGTVPFTFDTDAGLEKEACSAYMFCRPHVNGTPDSIDYVFNSMPGYRFIATRGKLSQINGNRPEVLDKRIEIAGTEENPEWELLACELDMTTGDGDTMNTCDEFVDDVKSTPFESTVERTQVEFQHFAKSLCPWSTTALSHTESLASYVIWATTIRAGGHLTREAILMSKLWMNRAWSWDNCLNALGVADADLELALNQLLLFSDLQARNGRLPDSIDWLFVEWGHTKPPIQGWAIARLLEMRGTAWEYLPLAVVSAWQ